MPIVAEPEKLAGETRLTLADLVDRFGPLPPERIRMNPPPGTATEEDAIRINERKEGLCELIDGILLEKTMGWYESYLGGRLLRAIGGYVDRHNLGIVLGEQAMIRLWPGHIRLPDCCYLSWQRMKAFPDKSDAAINLGPDLVVEVISPGNTRKEMEGKLKDYFQSGVLEVWYVYPTRRELHQFVSVDEVAVIKPGEMVQSNRVLPGFSLDLAKLFEDPRP